ncbi:lysozyme inhibitor LprI family protein [Emticicia sp. SJ17W-69]|uniref:lysozyme inhibitor LprI family protein n=1 Tax=Emticicia sp. SJ17W-69 TaxID=3421657 RepID=UPI003EB76FD3
MKKQIKFIGIAFFFMNCFFAKAQSKVFDNYEMLRSNDKRISQIDSFVKKCLSTNEGSSTLGMRGCYYEGTVKMDSLLNIVYKEALQMLKKEDQEKLRISQRTWLKFFEAETGFTNEVFRSWSNYSKYGYGSQINITESVMTYTLISERVNRLCYYLTAE